MSNERSYATLRNGVPVPDSCPPELRKRVMEIRSGKRTAKKADERNTSCDCDCPECQAGDCAECSNEDCKDPNCDCNEARSKRSNAAGCNCDCPQCADDDCAECSNDECDDPKCDCTTEKNARSAALNAVIVASSILL